jgi:hypothetical protein
VGQKGRKALHNFNLSGCFIKGVIMEKRTLRRERDSSGSASRNHQEYSRIITAAVINMQFRQLLLSNPGKAIDSGYGGEIFSLAREEKNRVAAIRATSLADFASQLSQVLDYNQAMMHAGD